MLNLFSIILLLLFSATSYAVINGASVTVSGTTLCNNGTIEKTFAGTMTTTCGAGWSVGELGVGDAGILFADNFDAVTDFVSSNAEALNYAADGDNVPDNWYAMRQSSSWAPSNGYPDNHESIEILASNSDKARGGTGKSFVAYRESGISTSNEWVSDGILMQYFPSGYDEIYVEFWIRFPDTWTSTSGWTTKIFRMSSWDKDGGQEITRFFSGGGSGPINIWDYQVTGYGVRNAISLRGGPHGDNYGMVDIPSFPRALASSGDASLNWTDNTQGQGPGGSNPQVPDLVNGGFISDNYSQTVSHAQIYGSGSNWSKMAYYVKMNSAPSVADGELKMWINDVMILNNTAVPWTGATAGAMPKWNVVGIGGNSYFNEYDAVDLHEEWYSIDDIIIRSGIPAGIEQ